MKEPSPDLIRILARLHLRVATADELVDWALAERMAGGEGHYLQRLSELGGALDLEAALSYLERAVAEAGYDVPDASPILRAYVRHLAEGILVEALDPYQACGLLCRIWLQLGQPDDLAPWGFLDDGLTADGAGTLAPDLASAEIRRQAETLLAAR